MAIKKTQKAYFVELREVVEAAVEDEMQKADLFDFIDKKLGELEKRKVSEKARQEKRKAASDALTQEIFEAITEDLATVDMIVAELCDEEDLTRAKVVARLGKLVKQGVVVKEKVRTDEGTLKMAYRLATEEDAGAVTEQDEEQDLE